MFFVNQKKHTTSGNWDCGSIPKNSRDEAMHQFHAFLSTYGYGQNAELDYVSCSVEEDNGIVIKSEIDDRREAG